MHHHTMSRVACYSATHVCRALCASTNACRCGCNATAELWRTRNNAAVAGHYAALYDLRLDGFDDVDVRGV